MDKTDKMLKQLIHKQTGISPSIASVNGEPFILPNYSGNHAFPIGSVFIAVVDTDPGILLGYGTWETFATGRVLVGIDEEDSDFDTVEKEGGAKSTAVSVLDHMCHVHSGPAAHSTGSTGTTGIGVRFASILAANHGNTGFETSSLRHSVFNGSNLQPYIVVYMWKRTA